MKDLSELTLADIQPSQFYISEQKLAAAGVPFKEMEDGSGRWFTLSDDVEVFENWLMDRVELVDGVPVVSLRGLREMKAALGREKDLRDIARIDAFLRGEPL